MLWCMVRAAMDRQPATVDLGYLERAVRCRRGFGSVYEHPIAVISRSPGRPALTTAPTTGRPALIHHRSLDRVAEVELHFA